MHDHACLTLDGSDATIGGEGEDEQGCPKYYKYTKRTRDFTNRNGGWTRGGCITLYNELYKNVKEDRETDKGLLGKCTRSTGHVCPGRNKKGGLLMGLTIG